MDCLTVPERANKIKPDKLQLDLSMWRLFVTFSETHSVKWWRQKPCCEDE